MKRYKRFWRSAGEDIYFLVQIADGAQLSGYIPSRPPDGKWRNIRVQLQPRPELNGLKVIARRGYYANPR